MDTVKITPRHSQYDYIPHVTTDAITYPCPDLRKYVIKWAPGAQQLLHKDNREGQRDHLNSKHYVMTVSWKISMDYTDLTFLWFI